MLPPEYAGKLNFYLSAVDDILRHEHDNPSIGILLCSELYKKYGHRFLVIKNEQVIGSYLGFDDALDETLKAEKPGTFLIQECVENPDDLILHFHQNIRFTAVP